MITVIGSLNMDLVTYVKSIPKIGETVIGNKLVRNPGGKGANQADAIAKIGSKVVIIGCVGADDIGRCLIETLQKDSVDISHVRSLPGKTTGIALITVDENANNHIVLTPGANFLLSPEHIKESEQVIADSKIILLQLEIPLETVRYTLKTAKALGKTTILNPAPVLMIDDGLLSDVDLLIPNELELEQLRGYPIQNEAELIAASREIIDRGVKHVIVTIGEKGCIYVNKNQYRKFPAYAVEAVDTTAAGDSFIAAIAVMLNEGKQIEEAILFASAAASLTVTKMGAQNSLPDRKAVDLRLLNNIPFRE